jgi:hypothetical protein
MRFVVRPHVMLTMMLCWRRAKHQRNGRRLKSEEAKMRKNSSQADCVNAAQTEAELQTLWKSVNEVRHMVPKARGRRLRMGSGWSLLFTRAGRPRNEVG